MNSGWQTKLLQELCSIFDDGDWVESKDQSEAGIRLIQTGNVGIGQFKDRAEKARYISEETFARLRCTEIMEGDCLVSRLPDPVGRACIMPDVGKKMITAVDCTIIRFKRERINPLFFNYYAQSKAYLNSVESLITGATRQRISRSNLGQVPIPVPPLAEQKRIVAALDEAFAGIAKATENAKKNLANARELFEIHLQIIFTTKGEGWVEKKLGDVLLKTEIVNPTKKPNEEFTYLDVASVNKETKEIETATVLLGKDAPSRARKLVRTNDVIFATVRPTHSRVALITKEYDKQICSTGYFVLRTREFLNNNLVFYFLLTDIFNKQMETLQKGASYPAVTDSEVKGIYISYPVSLIEQQLIITQLDTLSVKIKQLEAIYHKKLESLAALKQSILQKAFAGELKEKTTAQILQFPHKMPKIHPTDLHAAILGMSYLMHEANDNLINFTDIKAEKIAHIMEAYAGVDLGRKAVQNPRGPNDYPHLKKVESRAKKAGYCLFESRNHIYNVTKYKAFDSLIERTRSVLDESNYIAIIDGIINLMTPMSEQQAEIFATVFAAWNNLLIEKQVISDEAIVLAARENWHPEKLNIPREKFFDAINWMKQKDIIPQGIGKYVGKPSS